MTDSTPQNRPLAPDQYPRVLIVYMSCLNQSDQHGVSLRGWFADWPKERLAQIYSGADRGGEKFCGCTLQLGPDERRFGRVFFKLKQSLIGEGSHPVHLRADTGQTLRRVSQVALWRSRLSAELVKSGLWEVLFPPRLSPRLLAWVEAYQPQAIYCQGYSLAFAWLPVWLARRYNLPLCFQTGDDWPAYLYGESLIAGAIRPLVRRAAVDLIKQAAIRFANGDRMAEDYAERFAQPFIPLMMGDQLSRFRAAEPCRVVDADTLSLIYSGNLELGRWQSLEDVYAAAEALRATGYRIKVTALASTLSPEGVNRLLQLPNLQILPPPAHDRLPAYLKGADVLVLPETFDAAKAAEFRLSISTKAHLYMMSERPILVYGSPIMGVVDYAQREGWAQVVDERSPQRLVAALRQLIDDSGLRQRLVQSGLEVALKNHDETAIRQRFVMAFQDMVARHRN